MIRTYFAALADDFRDGILHASTWRARMARWIILGACVFFALLCVVLAILAALGVGGATGMHTLAFVIDIVTFVALGLIRIHSAAASERRTR